MVRITIDESITICWENEYETRATKKTKRIKKSIAKDVKGKSQGIQNENINHAFYKQIIFTIPNHIVFLQ